MRRLNTVASPTRLALHLCLVAMFAAGSLAAEDREQAGREPTASEMLADAAIARPIGLLGTIIGAAAFVVTLPFTLPSGSVRKAAHNFVESPYAYTFKRPLGQFDDCDARPDSCR